MCLIIRSRYINICSIYIRNTTISGDFQKCFSALAASYQNINFMPNSFEECGTYCPPGCWFPTTLQPINWEYMAHKFKLGTHQNEDNPYRWAGLWPKVKDGHFGLRCCCEHKSFTRASCWLWFYLQPFLWSPQLACFAIYEMTAAWCHCRDFQTLIIYITM